VFWIFGSGLTAVIFATTDEGVIPETSRLKLNLALLPNIFVIVLLYFSACSQLRPLFAFYVSGTAFPFVILSTFLVFLTVLRNFSSCWRSVFVFFSFANFAKFVACYITTLTFRICLFVAVGIFITWFVILLLCCTILVVADYYCCYFCYIC